MSAQAAHDGHDHHPQEGFWRKYIFSVDHKIIGIQYGITALIFLLIGFCLMILMRWQLAYPGQPVPILGAPVAPQHEIRILREVSEDEYGAIVDTIRRCMGRQGVVGEQLGGLEWMARDGMGGRYVSVRPLSLIHI